ncbi:MAG: FAD-binding oxidoreductase [Solirubrobacteraceae bacterium]
MATASAQAPATFEAAASLLSQATAQRRSVRIVGAGTKLDWGHPVQTDIELRTGGLGRIVEHNAGDLTARLEAGVELEQAQRTFAVAGQMLALDPPLSGAATIGGVVATGDCGPLRHRYGAPRDLVVGVTVALADGTIAQAGGRVIKNVAGYDLAKLFSGAFGTLGLILAVNVRLHPRHEASVTAIGSCGDPELLAAASRALAAAPLEFEALDVAWRDGAGSLLARCAGPQSAGRAGRAAAMMRDVGLTEVDLAEPDEALWERQRSGQRSAAGALVRVAALPSALAAVIRAASGCEGALVGRAALGHSFVEVEPEAVSQLRALLPAGAVATLLDAPVALRAAVDAWGSPADRHDAAIELMRRVKARFDPTGTCNPGLFAGGI